MLIRRACSVIVVAAAVLAAPVNAADDTTREALLELPHVVDEVMHRWDVPGVALAVVYDGEVVFSEELMRVPVGDPQRPHLVRRSTGN